MAGETYYFIFSVITVVGTILYLAQLLSLKFKGRALIGPNFRPGSLEQRRVVALAGKRNVTITITLALLSVANLVYAVTRILALNNQDYERSIFIFAPIGVILFFIVMVIKMSHMFSGTNDQK